MTDLIRAILNRSSEPRLEAPAPEGETLDRILQCAAMAPDHALLRPWRYLVIEGEGLDRLGGVFAQTGETDAEREKFRKMPHRAPMVIVAITSFKPHPKVPDIEQSMSTAAGVGYMLLALESAGFGGMWRTGAMAYAPQVHAGLGLSDDEAIAGFLYVGSVSNPKPHVPRPEVGHFVQRWPSQAD
ncbi:nitroreductase family protein [Marinobacter zhejiangensis]|uniref:Putative NAD(P)H nitroreductase n=1 Tax=Marinobacter zhejiangensis TaxID=488535 RepID=A0A1I4P7P8_9GAMM|nr:nitroreductase [Marinobacter zhejiangensis]SFM23610.1 Nitroreductase [Marinobacter zhejiangensis]